MTQGVYHTEEKEDKYSLFGVLTGILRIQEGLETIWLPGCALPLKYVGFLSVATMRWANQRSDCSLLSLNLVTVLMV